MGQRKVATRSAQWPLMAEFVFNWDDSIVDVNGAVKDFKTAGAVVADVINLPPGSIIEGGEVVGEAALAGGTATLAIGDKTSDVRYLAATAVTAARVPLVPTGFVSTGENLRATFTVTGTLTAGKASVRVWYVIRDRANEVIPN